MLALLTLPASARNTRKAARSCADVFKATGSGFPQIASRRWSMLAKFRLDIRSVDRAGIGGGQRERARSFSARS